MSAVEEFVVVEGDEPTPVKQRPAWEFSTGATDWEKTARRTFPSVGKIATAMTGQDVPTHLFYGAAVNMLFGDSNAGKSWIALTIARQEIKLGHYVVWLDFEAPAHHTRTRLRSLGCTRDEAERLVIISANGKFDADPMAQLDAVVDHFTPSLLIIDTAGEAMGAEGRDGSSDPDVIAWRNLLPYRYATKGLCVIEIDHVGVGFEAQTRVAGSHRKRAGLTGISFQAIAYKGHGHKKGQRGRTKLVCRKDREGTYETGELVAIFEHEDDAAGQRGSVLLRPPTEFELTPGPGTAGAVKAHEKLANQLEDFGINLDQGLAKIVAELSALGIPSSKETVGLAKAIVVERQAVDLDDDGDEVQA